MNLKIAALIGALLVLVSIPLSIAAQGLIYAPMLMGFFNWSMVLSMAATIVRVLLAGGGLVLFLAGSARLANTPAAGRKGLLLTGGILMLVGMLISGLYAATTLFSIARHGNLLERPVLIFLLMTSTDLLAWTCVIVFIFTRALRAAGGRAAAIAAIAALLILCAMLAVSLLQTPPWDQKVEMLTTIGALVSIAAFGLQVGGVLLYLVMYVMTPPAADATDALSAAPQ